ncbi:MAG: hypothetical protein Q9225_004994 [Loekoesia sp. 1 TL-2023]
MPFCDLFRRRRQRNEFEDFLSGIIPALKEYNEGADERIAKLEAKYQRRKERYKREDEEKAREENSRRGKEREKERENIQHRLRESQRREREQAEKSGEVMGATVFMEEKDDAVGKDEIGGGNSR